MVHTMIRKKKTDPIVCPDQCDSKKIGIVAKHVTCAMVENLKGKGILHSASSDSETKSGKAISTLPVLESKL
jgi:hypothetical protein